MEKFKMIERIKELYKGNENIIKYLKAIDKRLSNTTEDILISYDFQAGTYIQEYKKIQL